MKLLRSPWVSGALAVIAVVVVAYQFLPAPRPKAAPGVVSPPPATASAARPNPPTQTTTNAAETPDLPPVAIERAAVESRFAHWAEAPDHDPFWLLPAATEPVAHKYPSPVLFWKLNGIWRQTDGRVAAINNQIYAEGEQVHGYRILKIDASQVVFQGPDGPEVLVLSAATPKPAKKK